MLALHAYFIKSCSLIHLKPQATTANVKLYNYIQFTDLVQGQNMLEIELICKLDIYNPYKLCSMLAKQSKDQLYELMEYSYSK